jgi:hypothetical protein
VNGKILSNKIALFLTQIVKSSFLFAMVFMRFFKFVTGVSLLSLSFLDYAQPNPQWVQMVANDQLSVRVVLLKLL